MSKKKKKTASTGVKKRTPKDDKEQSQRFVETAEDLGVDKTGKAFEDAMDRIKPSDD